MINLNGKQIIAIVGAVVSVLMVSTAQLTDLLGPGLAKTITTVAGLLNMLLQSITVALTSQGSTLRDVAAMPGVEKVLLNGQANSTAATLAVDPMQDKIEAAPGAHAAVEQASKGN